MFLDDAEGPSTSGGGDGGQRVEMEELPTAVVTVLTKCYAPSCGEGGKCYTYGCPRGDGVSLKAKSLTFEPKLISRLTS
jgi:hypothetical protein